MPSPFPGMDPYLEDPRLWPDVHHGLISQAQAELNGRLRPKYHVRVEERIYVSDECDPGRRLIIPDLRVAKVPGKEKELISSSESDIGGGLAVAEPVIVTTLLDEEIHDAYLEVIDATLRKVVTVIEILSPTNKCASSKGRAAYLRKRQEVMSSPCHFVEIDLLREGEQLMAREILPPHDYIVHLSGVQNRPQGVDWPIQLQQRLPVIDIPLNEEDPDAKLDLQTVLNAAYDRAAYDLEIDYHKDPTPSLPPSLSVWAAELLKEE